MGHRELSFFLLRSATPFRQPTPAEEAAKMQETIERLQRMSYAEHSAYMKEVTKTPQELEDLTSVLKGETGGQPVGLWSRIGHSVVEREGKQLFVKTTIFWVDDFEAAEKSATALLSGTEFEATWSAERDRTAGDGVSRSIEIYYKISDIPPDYSDPLEFRNAAMDLIETALDEAEAGEWVGAESGMGEVNFGFDVTNFKRAEQIVRKAVKGTPFAGIDRISRSKG